MDQAIIEKKQGKPRVLVAPLDWGLGHATRCIPIIRELLNQGADVWLAGEKEQERLLSAEFPHLPFLHLAGYRINYAKTKKGLLWKMISQSPKLLFAIKAENKWLVKAVKNYQLDLIISDNRYGLYHPTVPSIFITHQLTIKSPAGKWSEKIIRNRNYKLINRFTACWVPDNENKLAGELSHPETKPAIPVHYTGPLSRFEKKEIAVQKDHLLFVLSGPEPQRTILEEKVIKQVSHYNGTATIVRGLPGTSSIIPSTNMLLFYNHLSATMLNDEMLKAEYIIGRSGYSSVMDIVALQKKSILIPTPGQTEQEYLGKYLMEKEITLSVSQKTFSLTDSLNMANKFKYKFPALAETNSLQKIISNVLYQLKRSSLG